MALDKELLEILCCPETRQPLRLAGSVELASLNEAIGRGKVKDPRGGVVREPVEEALVREDGGRAYAVRGGIPVLLLDEALLLDGIR